MAGTTNDNEFDSIKLCFKFELKHEQKKIIHKILQGRDVNAVLPTGFGKPMCFIVPPLIKDMQVHLHLFIRSVIFVETKTDVPCPQTC